MFGECPKKTTILNAGVPSAKYGGGSVTIWTATTWYCAGPIITLNGELLLVTTWTF
jgi:hypothetical protein